jgi:hypothetical protein
MKKKIGIILYPFIFIASIAVLIAGFLAIAIKSLILLIFD